MDESPAREMAGDEQTAGGIEPAEGQDRAAAETPEGESSGSEQEPTAGPEPAEGRADIGGDASWSGEPGTGGWRVRDESARDWVAQLQGMIDTIGEHAGPVLREVAAKAAELAAVAAENAGPALQRAADVTTEVGRKVAVRSKEYAAELRRQQGEQAGHAEQGGEPGTDAEPGH